MRTQRSYFSYWKYKGAPPAPDSVPDAMINLREIARVVKHRDNFTFELYRADGEKVLVLKAETEMVRARPRLTRSACQASASAAGVLVLLYGPPPCSHLQQP